MQCYCDFKFCHDHFHQMFYQREMKGIDTDKTISRRPSSLNFDNEKILLTDPPRQWQSRRRRILRRVKNSRTRRSPFQISELTFFIIHCSIIALKWHRITVLLSLITYHLSLITYTNHCITFAYQQLMLLNYFRLWFYLISVIPWYFNWANGWLCNSIESYPQPFSFSVSPLIPNQFSIHIGMSGHTKCMALLKCRCF